MKNVLNVATVMRFVLVMFLTGQIKRKNPSFFTRSNVGTAGPVGWSAQLTPLSIISLWEWRMSKESMS
jgi:hypothetical protein